MQKEKGNRENDDAECFRINTGIYTIAVPDKHDRDPNVRGIVMLSRGRVEARE